MQYHRTLSDTLTDIVIPCHTLSDIVGHAPTHNMERMIWTMAAASLGQQLRQHGHWEVPWLEHTALADD